MPQRSRLLSVIGLVSCVAGALIGQSHQLEGVCASTGINDLWRHALTIAFIVGTALTGYFTTPPPPPWDGSDRRSTHSHN